MASINSRGRYVKTCSKDGSNSIDFRDCSYSSAGIVSPVIVRPLENTTDEYEIISGHRRIMASRKAGIMEVPALVVFLDRDAAADGAVAAHYAEEYLNEKQ